MSYQEETPINTLFERKTDVADSEICVKTSDLQRRERARDITKQLLRTKIETMRAEYESANDRKNLKFSRLVKAVVEANAQENRATEKFLDNVESIMDRFNNDLCSLGKIYESVLKRLPKNE